MEWPLAYVVPATVTRLPRSTNVICFVPRLAITLFGLRTLITHVSIMSQMSDG